ncbi:MAG: thiopurine S-methyltransferase, partial [Bacteroidota bacterium]
MDSSFWQNRWRENRIGFHQGSVNSRLRRHFAEIAGDAKECVFIPLCGKSLDILWIADQGHPVVGVEL